MISDMYTCDVCGKPTPNFTPWTGGPIAGKLGRSWCDDSPNDDGYECSHCGKPFIVRRIVDITYTSKRRIEDMPEGWRSNDDQ